QAFGISTLGALPESAVPRARKLNSRFRRGPHRLRREGTTMRPNARVAREQVVLGIVLVLAALILGSSVLLVGPEGPGGPAISDRPSAAAEVQGDEVTIRWDPLNASTGFPVVGFRVRVGRTLVLTLPASVTHVKLPQEYTRSLAPGAHGFEVLAIDDEGSQ